MRRTIARRRAAIESALRTRLPDAFDRATEESLESNRSRFRGQVFLALVDGFDCDRSLEDVVPLAASLELVSLQTRLHRRAIERFRRSGTLPTEGVLVGDLLESKAFELATEFDAEPVLVERCFGALVEATRSVQEGQSLLAASGTDPDALDPADERRIGALTGCAAELAALLTGVDSRRELARRGSRVGFSVRRHRPESRLSPDRTRDSTDRSQLIDPLLEACPPAARASVRDQLSAVLEAHLDREPADPIA